MKSISRDAATGRAGHVRIRVVLVTAIALASLLGPGAAKAGSATFTFDVSIGSSCISGTGPASSTIALTLMDRDNQVIDTETATSDGSGDWNADQCFWFDLHATDKIRAAVGPSSRTFQVPDVTVNIARASDVISGKAPATGTFHLYTTLCETYNCTSGPDVNVNVASNGTYSRDFTALHNLKGNDRALGRWTSPAGDFVDSLTRTVPYMSLVIGDDQVRGQGKPGQTVTATLRTAGGVLIGSGSDTVGIRSPSISLDLRTSSGLPAYPRPGNKVTSNVASDAKLTVPAITLTLTDADTVAGHCFNNGPVYVYLEHYQPGYEWTEAYTTAGSAGNFSLDMADTSNSSYVPASGERFEVDCQNVKGDIVARYSRFP
jgi:hypothetical protein